MTLLFVLGLSVHGQTELAFGEFSNKKETANQNKISKVIGFAEKSTDEYCIPEGMDCSDGDGLQGFALANIDNLSSGCSDNGYGDYTALNIQLAQGSVYTLQALCGYSGNTLNVWIDYNDDEVFTEDELLIQGLLLLNNEITETEIIMDPSATVGAHRLRATVAYQNTNPDPCEVYNYGECEDYTVTIIEPNYKDVAVLSIEMTDAVSVGEITPKAKVVVLGTQLADFTVTMTDGENYSSTVTVSDMLFGEIAVVEFEPYTATAGTYTFEACADMNGDVNADNDCNSKEVLVESFDAGVTNISLGATISAGQVVPSVNVTNYTNVVGSGEVKLTMDGYSSTKSFSDLPSNGALWVQMDPWDAAVGDYVLEACVISNDSDPSNDCSTQAVTVIPPEMNFIANETVVLTGLNLTFYNKSDYNISSYQWTFEGGTPTTSTEINPVVTYNTPGVYDATLVITHSGGTETIIKEDYIEVSDDILASFEIINNVDEFPIYSVFFIDENIGFANMGSVFSGKYGKTIDGGDNWEVITVPGISRTITGIMFVDDMNGFFRASQYGSPAQVYSTIDGGENWEFYAQGPHSQLFRMDAYDNSHVIICGQQSIYNTDVSVTSSGPSGWVDLLSPEADPWSQYQGVQYLSADSIFAMRFMDVNFSYDGGATWENKTLNSIFNGGWENFGLNDVSFPNHGKYGFAAGSHYNEGGGIILRSVDNGDSWDDCGRGFDEGRHIHFYDRNIGVATGHNGFIYKTSDGGDTWYGTNLNEGNMGSPFVVNENLIFACVQGKCYRSKNGFFQQPITKDLMLSEINMPNSILVDNAPFDINIAMKNVGREMIDTYTLSYQVDDNEIVTEQFDPYYLTPNNVIVTDSFDMTWSPEAGQYTIKIWIDAVDGNSDQNLSNDTLVHDVLVTGDQWDNRKVLLEEATGTWCGYCVNGVLTIEALEENFNTDKTRVIPIAIHGNDLWEIENAVDILDIYCGGSYPTGWVDRTKYFGEASVGLETGKWGLYTAQQLTSNAPMNVEIAASINISSRMLEINTEASFYADIEGELRFSCYILEDHLKANQSNAYNGISGHPYYGLGDPIQNFDHKHVLREILEDSWGVQGELPNSVSSGESYEHVFQYSVPEEFELSNVSVVCFVAKYNEDINEREVLNANVAYYSDFTPVGIDGINSSAQVLKVFPNPAKTHFTVQWFDKNSSDAQIELMNYTGQTILTKKIYSKNGFIKESVNTSHLVPGVYYIKAKSESFTAITKVIVQ